MRWMFLLIIVVLFETISYGAGRGLQWWSSAWLNEKPSRYVLWSVFAISHVFLLLAITRVSAMGLKIAMSWLTVLWIMIMAFVATALLMAMVNKIFPDLAGGSEYSLWGGRGAFVAIFTSLMAWAVYNAYTPVVRHLTITSDKMVQPLRVAMVSDLHLGWLVGNRELDNLTDIVKAEKAQIVLMPGDIMDDNVQEYQAKKMQPHLENLVKSVPLGVYASLGNHDMYGHEADIRGALATAGVKLLADENTLVNNQFWLVGRLDNHAQNRKQTAELMPATLDKPIILLDHEPNGIDKNVQLPIDLQVSGHTHNGQIFPANFIVQAMNTVGYGHKKINNTDVVVSSGYGFWGVPFRLASQSEVWIIDIVPKSQ